MNELEQICQKFINREYSVDDLSRRISVIAVPDIMLSKIKETENKLEYIRFCVPDNEQYDQCVKIINKLLDYNKK